MNIKIFHSVNSALFFWDGSTGLWVDGIHSGKELGFSPMPDFLSGQLSRRTGLFAHTHALLFTHLHSDHFQEEGVETLLGFPNPPLVYGPGLSKNTLIPQPLARNICSLKIGNFSIILKDTIHDGEQFRNDRHQSFLFQNAGNTLFVAGDAELIPEDAEAFRKFCLEPIDVAFVNLYQLSSPQGREALRQLRPNRILIDHLPLREDDCYHYRSLARQLSRQQFSGLPEAEVLTHMAWVDGQSAEWGHDMFFYIQAMQQKKLS